MRSTVTYTDNGIRIEVSAENEADKLLLKLIDRDTLSISRNAESVTITQPIQSGRSSSDGWGR